jgi:hypothetical protein
MVVGMAPGDWLEQREVDDTAILPLMALLLEALAVDDAEDESIAALARDWRDAAHAAFAIAV